MLKVTIVETRNQRRIILEGTLIQPWTTELKKTWAAASDTSPQARQLIVDLNNVTTISKDGEDVLSQLMQDGAKFSCVGVLTKFLVKQLALKRQAKPSAVMNRNPRKD
jgi:outer membrane PBP1 activator LpoA protein